MRTSTIQVALLICSFAVNQVHALDTTVEENTCQEIGFKKKTETFANCVLELIERKKMNQQISVDPTDKDGVLCLNYGYKPNTNEFASCKFQIDQVRKDAARRQAQFDNQQKQYEAQLAEYQKQKEIAANMALMQCGLNMMAGGTCTGGRRVGDAPLAPQPLSPVYQTITMPGGRMVHCTTTGIYTNCY